MASSVVGKPGPIAIALKAQSLWGPGFTCRGTGHGTSSPRSLVAAGAHRVTTAPAGHSLALRASRCPAKAGDGGVGEHPLTSMYGMKELYQDDVLRVRINSRGSFLLFFLF